MFSTINNNTFNFPAGAGAGAPNAVPANSFPINIPTNTVLHIDALVSGGMRLPGGGWLNASVFKAESFTPENPVMLVKGTDTDGSTFEVEINANEINPRNASFIELFALDGYFASKGQHLRSAREAGLAMSTKDIPGVSGFTRFDFLPSLTEAMEIQLEHRNWEAFRQLQHVVDTLLRIADRHI